MDRPRQTSLRPGTRLASCEEPPTNAELVVRRVVKTGARPRKLEWTEMIDPKAMGDTGRKGYRNFTAYIGDDKLRKEVNFRVNCTCNPTSSKIVVLTMVKSTQETSWELLEDRFLAKEVTETKNIVKQVVILHEPRKTRGGVAYLK